MLHTTVDDSLSAGTLQYATNEPRSSTCRYASGGLHPRCLSSFPCLRRKLKVPNPVDPQRAGLNPGVYYNPLGSER